MLHANLQAAARPARSALQVQARASRSKPPAKPPAKPTKGSKQPAAKGKKEKAAGGAKGGGELKDGAGEGAAARRWLPPASRPCSCFLPAQLPIWHHVTLSPPEQLMVQRRWREWLAWEAC